DLPHPHALDQRLRLGAFGEHGGKDVLGGFARDSAGVYELHERGDVFGPDLGRLQRLGGILQMSHEVAHDPVGDGLGVGAGGGGALEVVGQSAGGGEHLGIVGADSIT